MDDVENYNPFDSNTQEILDTDYDNFLFMYQCKQHDEMINAKGQSQSLINQMKADDIEQRASVGVRAKESIHLYMNTLGGNKKFVKFVHVIQQQLASEHEDETKKLNDAQLHKEMDYFLSCDPNFRSLFFRMEPTLDAWKKIRGYFDYYVQKEMEDHKDTQESTTENIDLSDLPVYDEQFTPKTQHQLSLTMFVRNLENLTDEKYNEHLARLTLMVPDHALEFPEHERIMHDETDCPAEDVDPFEQKNSISYMNALTQ